MSASVKLPLHGCTIKSRSFSSGTSSPGWSRKSRKTVVVVVVVVDGTNVVIKIGEVYS